MPTDYGTDLSLTSDLDPNGLVITGRRLVLEALVRRLSTPRGGLWYAPDYGFDLRVLVGESFTPGELRQLEHDIADECRKDERVGTARVSVSLDVVALRMVVTIRLFDADGPFELVLGVDQVTVAILRGDA